MRELMMRVEVPDAANAASLLAEVFPLQASVVQADDTWEVHIPGEHEPSRSLVEGLNAVQRWLVESKVPAATVHVDGRAYNIAAGLWVAPRGKSSTKRALDALERYERFRPATAGASS